MDRFLLIVSAALGCWFLSSCCTNRDVEESAAVMISDVRKELHPIEGASPGKPTSSQRAYLENYRITGVVDGYQFGTFQAGGQTLAANIFRSRRPNRSTVIIVHGYLDHAGVLSHLINRLTAEGYNVAVYDQPGHGLSGGRRASIRDFSNYHAGFSHFFQLVQHRLPPPYHVVCHSMGGTIVTEHLLLNRSAPLKRVVFLAPAIRDALPAPMQILGRTIAPVIDHLPRVSLGSSSDPDYEERMKRDPLRTQCVSTRWTRALHRWVRKYSEYPSSTRRPLVINAEFENVVDLEFSTRWLQRTFPEATFAPPIKGGHHHLLNETEPIREQVLDLISRELRR